MSVAPIPVLRLLLVVRLREFVRTLVVFRKILPPGAIFVVIPVVIILVALIVDSTLCGAMEPIASGGAEVGHAHTGWVFQVA